MSESVASCARGLPRGLRKLLAEATRLDPGRRLDVAELASRFSSL